MSDNDSGQVPVEIEAAMAAVTAGLLNAGQLVGQYLEASVGYRQKCIDAGFSNENAQTMAVDFHRMLMQSIT